MPAPAAAAAVVGQVVGALAELPGKIKGFIDSITGFVAAADPSSVRVMNDALKSLNATIGFALQPVIVGFTELVKDVAGELFEPMNSLREVVSDLVSDAVGMVQPLLGTLGDLLRDGVENLRGFMPAVKAITATLVGMANVTGYLIRVWQAVANAVLAFASPWSQLPDATEQIGRAFARATIGVMRFTDWILRAVGLGSIADKILRGVGGRRVGGRPAAVENVQMGDVQSVYRARLLEAGRATGGGGLVKQQVDYLAEIAEEARALRKRADENGKETNAFFDWVRRAFGDVAAPAPRPRRNDEENPRPPWRDPELGGG